MEIDKFPLIGVIHLPSLTDPKLPLESIYSYAIEETRKLEQCGFSAAIVENFNDAPFAKTIVSDYVFSKFSLILNELKKETKIPIGVNILRNACVQAMTIASVLDLSFIRCNIWESAYVTDQGIIEGAAYDVIKYKNQLNSSVKVFADIYVKHASPLGSFSLIEAAENALDRGKADQIIISGKTTGSPPAIEMLEGLSEKGIKPIIGSGFSLKNLNDFASYIQGAIVGTSIKMDNIVSNPIDEGIAKKLVEKWVDTFN